MAGHGPPLGRGCQETVPFGVLCVCLSGQGEVCGPVYEIGAWPASFGVWWESASVLIDVGGSGPVTQ